LSKQRDSVPALFKRDWHRGIDVFPAKSRSNREQSLLGNNYSAIAIDRAISSVSESSYIVPRAGWFSATAVETEVLAGTR
jgi:hypothetical protein